MAKDPSADPDDRPGDEPSALGQISLAQFENVRAAAALDGVELETEPPGLPPKYIWRRDHILLDGSIDETRYPALKELGAVLAKNLDGSDQVVSPDRAKLLQLTRPGDRNTRDSRDFLRKSGVEASFDTLLYVADEDGANICPADEPTPVLPYPHSRPYPPASRGKAGRGVRVTVIDTGLFPDWEVGHPWLNGGDPPEVSGQTEPQTFTSNMIQPDAGHGTFIAGIIRCVAPRSTVKVANTMRWAGAMTESEVARTIIAELDAYLPPHIINLSGGCLIPERGRPRAMLDVLNRLQQPDCRTLLVAAAGNDGSDVALFYPAAFAPVDPFVAGHPIVSVGALRQNRAGRACFSNSRRVTLFEDGERLVNAFPTGRFVYREPLSQSAPPQCVYHRTPLYDGCTCVTAPAKGATAHFRGMASWSGTSFSAPIVVGRVAAHMTERPKFANRPRAAMKDLLKQLVVIEDASDSRNLRIFPNPVG